MTADFDACGGTEPVQTVRRRAARAYDDTKRMRERDGRIVGHLWLVRHIARKMSAKLPEWISYEELCSAGVLGLVTAARDYDPTRKAEFSTYAYARVRGAMLDDLRSRSFAPPTVHARMRRIRGAYDEIAATSAGAPADEKVADRAEMPLEEFYRTLDDARRQTFLSMHGFVEDGPAFEGIVPTSREDDPAEPAERREQSEVLGEAISQLPEKERRVIVLYYKNDLNMKEIGRALGVNESRVSQLHSSALMKLSFKLRKRI